MGQDSSCQMMVTGSGPREQLRFRGGRKGRGWGAVLCWWRLRDLGRGAGHGFAIVIGISWCVSGCLGRVCGYVCGGTCCWVGMGMCVSGWASPVLL